MTKFILPEILKKRALYVLLTVFLSIIAYSIYSFAKRRDSANTLHEERSTSNLANTKVSVLTEVINIGRIKRGRPAEATFKIINTTRTPLLILNVDVDCHCTVATWDKNPIAFQDTAFIKGSYDSRIPGFFQKKIRVSLNADSSPLLLILRGEIML